MPRARRVASFLRSRRPSCWHAAGTVMAPSLAKVSCHAKLQEKQEGGQGCRVVFLLDQSGASRDAGYMHEDTERCVRAVQSKDARFDGWFLTAVLTTGI